MRPLCSLFVRKLFGKVSFYPNRERRRAVRKGGIVRRRDIN